MPRDQIQTPDTGAANRSVAPEILGMAQIVNHAYAGGDLQPVWSELLGRYGADTRDAAALLDMSVILQVSGQRDKGLELQRQALEISRSFSCPHGNGAGLRVLAFVTAGDFMANTPIDFLLEGSDVNLLLHFVDENTVSLAAVPEHDVAFVAVGESGRNRPVLTRLAALLQGWKGPILNNAPDCIKSLTRTGVATLFATDEHVYSPINVRVSRENLVLASEGKLPLSAVLLGSSWPIVVRPHDTHAGSGFCLVSDESELGVYLQSRPEEEFNVAPFVAYQSADGLYRKQRIAFIGGKAYASHMAISSHWMVHYLSAEMEQRAERRAEEALWMETFDEGFAVRHRAAFDSLVRKTGLDYFAIDCAEMPDGRLLLFELDVAMIVHSMDSGNLFPYKKPAMQKLFDSFHALFANAHAAGAKLKKIA